MPQTCSIDYCRLLFAAGRFNHWLIFGNIPTRAEGPGILIAGGGDIYQAVAADGPSLVMQVW